VGQDPAGQYFNNSDPLKGPLGANYSAAFPSRTIWTEPISVDATGPEVAAAIEAALGLKVDHVDVAHIVSLTKYSLSCFLLIARCPFLSLFFCLCVIRLPSLLTFRCDSPLNLLRLPVTLSSQLAEASYRFFILLVVCCARSYNLKKKLS
jgi:hypothetical protein